MLADPARINKEFRKAWLPHPCRSGQREASLDVVDREVDGWLPHFYQRFSWTGQVLADVFQRKGSTAGGLDGWCWRELKVLPVS